MSAEREEAEAEIRRRWDTDDWAGAATEALRVYGPEVLGFLYASLGNQADARDAFSALSESMWRSLRGFRWHCSFRTWAYALARSAIGRIARDPARRGRMIRLSDAPEVFEEAERVRTHTQPHLRSEARSHVRRLRMALSPDDQALLTLRIDRGLAWRDIAIVMAGDTLSEAELGQKAALFRKRFERLKDRLKTLVTDYA